jgi:hypothetical protein
LSCWSYQCSLARQNGHSETLQEELETQGISVRDFAHIECIRIINNFLHICGISVITSTEMYLIYPTDIGVSKY